MMRIKIDINGDFNIVELFVIRTDPTQRSIQQGEICSYELYEGDGGTERELLTEFQFPYGDGIQLGIEILEVYQSVLEFEKEEGS